jgi:hypothetical protein
MTARLFQWSLVVWTLGIWGSRIRNIVVDDEPELAARLVSLLVALALIGSALLLAFGLIRSAPWIRPALLVLAVLGVLRFTVRGPFILLDDQWDSGFKIVHTILWTVTVALSLLAWREHKHADTQYSTGAP